MLSIAPNKYAKSFPERRASGVGGWPPVGRTGLGSVGLQWLIEMPFHSPAPAFCLPFLICTSRHVQKKEEGYD